MIHGEQSREGHAPREIAARDEEGGGLQGWSEERIEGVPDATEFRETTIGMGVAKHEGVEKRRPHMWSECQGQDNPLLDAQAMVAHQTTEARSRVEVRRRDIRDHTGRALGVEMQPDAALDQSFEPCELAVDGLDVPRVHRHSTLSSFVIIGA